MEERYSFIENPNSDELAILKREWRESLISPQDGMWETFRERATNWGVFHKERLIGYTSIGADNELLQFYLSPKYLLKSESIFEDFIKKMNIKNGIVGTNNLCYLSVALNFVKELSIGTYLFRDHYEVDIEEKEGIIKECQEKDIDRIVNMYHHSMGAPKDWLSSYIGGLIKRREIFFLEDKGTVIGTCEVRKSITSPEFADIGMVVSPEYRNQGYGTYLLDTAKRKAIESGRTPICSCEKSNIGSIKSIHNCGFTSKYQLLSISFK